jgi:hypothetical protein
MRVCDEHVPPNTTRERAAGRSASGGRGGGSAPSAPAIRPAAPTCLPADLAEAERLISDLAALLDAGLVVAQEHVLGPARYGVVADMG